MLSVAKCREVEGFIIICAAQVFLFAILLAAGVVYTFENVGLPSSGAMNISMFAEKVSDSVSLSLINWDFFLE